MNTQKIKDSLRLFDDVIRELGSFARTATEKRYLTKPVVSARSRLVGVLLKVEFLQEARKHKIKNTSQFARITA